MKTLVRLACLGLIGFLLCMVISLWNISSDPGLSGMFLGLAIPCVTLFFGGMLGASSHIEETEGERAARCLHTARWLNRELLDNIKATDAIVKEAEDLSRKLSETAYDSAMLTRYQHDEATLNRLRLEFATTVDTTQSGVKEAQYLLDRLAAHDRASRRLLRLSNQAESKIRMANLQSGGKTWMAGPSVAGQYILVGEVEPQRILIVTNQAFKASVPRIEAIKQELAYARTQSQQCLDRLSAYMTSPKQASKP